MEADGELCCEKLMMQQPERFVFEDDGVFPNSRLPVLIYRASNGCLAKDPAAAFEKQFTENNWTNSWRNGVYPFAHYHSTSHEVLGVYSGSANLRLGGGTNGKVFQVNPGDVIVIPAGVAHQNVGSDADFGVVGAYPDGRDWDLLRGEPGDRPQADRNIEQLPVPENDPLYGSKGALAEAWKKALKS